MIRSYSFGLLGLEVFAEYPSVTQGHTFIDHVVEGGELLVWVGRFHAIVTPPWWKPMKSAGAADGPIVEF